MINLQTIRARHLIIVGPYLQSPPQDTKVCKEKSKMVKMLTLRCLQGIDNVKRLSRTIEEFRGKV